MKKIIILLFTVAQFSSVNFAATKPKQYKANWESLSQHEEIPQWLSDAKLGIYFHWGLYSVPAFKSEWYPYHMYRKNEMIYKHHNETYGKDFEYHQFADMFKAENFDAKEWAQLFKKSGARFAGPVAIHHDGYAMWDSKVNPWNTKTIGPMKDITGELLKELKKEGLKTITTFHHSRNLQRNADNPKEWATSGNSNCGYNSHFAYDPDRATSSKDPKLAKLYGNIPDAEFQKYWYDLIKEVIDQYSPDMIWFDSWLNLIPEENRQKMAAYYFNEARKKKQGVTIGFKQCDMPIEVGIKDIEQGGKKELSERVWMTDVTLSRMSWSYINGQRYKTPELVLRNMIDVWSKNGVVLLNISPMANGTIPDAQRTVLTSIGEWLSKYGEAVYNTIPFDIHGYGSAAAKDNHHGGQTANVQYTSKDVRFTCSKDNKSMYMFFLGKPEPGRLEISQLGSHRYPTRGKVKRVTLLGTDTEAKFEVTTNNAYITIPDVPMNEIATVFKFELE
ncbi:MAG: alpha-L-fucosidase [Rikenellaceae bacterium]